MRVRFVTSEWEFSNGRKPRGEGCWAFEFEGSAPWFAPGCLSFGEAKRAAAEEARRRFPNAPVVEVTVCP